MVKKKKSTALRFVTGLLIASLLLSISYAFYQLIILAVDSLFGGIDMEWLKWVSVIVISTVILLLLGVNRKRIRSILLG